MIPALPLAMLFACLSLFGLLVDSVVFSLFRTHLNWALIQMILSPARAQIFDLTSVESASLVGAFSVIVLLEILLCRLLHKKGLALKINSSLQLGLLLIALVVQGLYVWADAVYEPRILLMTELTPGFIGLTAKRTLAYYHLVKPNERPAELGKIKVNEIHYPKATLQHSAVKNKPNILFIVIDAWRYDMLNNEVTPNIAALAERSNRYFNHFSGGNSTRAGMFSLFYSLSPADFDIFYRSSKGPALFDLLYQQGYQVGAYTSASATSPPLHRTVFANIPDFEPDIPGGGSVERDISITYKMKAFIQKATASEKPYFAFAFYDSVHSYYYPAVPPYKAPFQPSKRVSYMNLSGKKEQLLMVNQYRNALYFIDGLIGNLLKELQKEGALDNTLIIVTSDHGEEFDDHGWGIWGHNSNFTPIQTKVPLLMHWPRQTQKKAYHHISSHYDVIPTLFKDVFAISNPIADYSLGATLDDPAERESILMGSYSNLAVFSPSREMIAVANKLGYFQLRNLQGDVLEQRMTAELFKSMFAQIQHFHAREAGSSDKEMG